MNTAILSAVNGFVLRPLPVEKPEELVAPYWGRKMDAHVWGQFSYANYVDLREQNKSFSDLCAWTETSAGISSGESRNAGDGERAEVVWGELVSGNYFDVMGVKPMLGRGFLPEEDRTPNAHPVVVLGHSLWQRRFDADAAIVGKTIYLNGLPFTVIGVMPESFLGSTFYLRQAFWVPLMMAQKFGRRAEWKTDRSYALFSLYGRLKPGLTMAQAETDLNLVADNSGATVSHGECGHQNPAHDGTGWAIWGRDQGDQVRRVAGLVCLRSGVAAGLRQRGESDAGAGCHARQGDRDSAGDWRGPGTHRAATADGERVACLAGRRAGVGVRVSGSGRDTGELFRRFRTRSVLTLRRTATC